MPIHVFDDKQQMGQAAAQQAAEVICRCIAEQGEARIILATGASQFEMLAALVEHDIDWTKVTAFHLDEYLELPITHPASFRKYLQERFVDKAVGLRQFHAIDGEADDPADECNRLGALIRSSPVDLACIGIGENGHLAFNDPPADFAAEESYLVVDLDDACRRQQVGEGWFASMADVPRQAISMSIQQIMRARCIVCTVPDQRKAEALRDALEGPVTNQLPASILQQHEHCEVFTDRAGARLLSK